jgi:hypothetical protein
MRSQGYVYNVETKTSLNTFKHDHIGRSHSRSVNRVAPRDYYKSHL